MSKSPSLRGSELIRALQRGGFVVVRIKGSHHVLRHSDGRQTVVPVHAREHIGPGLLRSILAECEMDLDQLRKLL